MSVTIPGTSISVDHFKDRTWREEFFAETGKDYTVRIWRERIGYADADEMDVVYQEKADIPAAPSAADGSIILGGKPRSIIVKLSDLAGNTTPLDVVSTQPKLGEIAALIVQANEIAAADADARRILEYKFANGIIEEDEYQAGIDALITTVDA